MKISEQLENDPKQITLLIVCLFGVLLFASLTVWQAGEWVDFIKAVTNHEAFIRITAGMGIFPAGLILVLLFTIGVFGCMLTLIAKYTQHPGLMDYDPSKSWLGRCLRLCFYGLIVFGSFYFILPLSSDTIALKLGYQYYCPRKAFISGESKRFYNYTYAKGPDLCPTTEDYRRESRRISPVP